MEHSVESAVPGAPCWLSYVELANSVWLAPLVALATGGLHAEAQQSNRHLSRATNRSAVTGKRLGQRLADQRSLSSSTASAERVSGMRPYSEARFGRYIRVSGGSDMSEVA